MRWELHYIRVNPTIFSCVDPRYQLSRFFTGISRRKYGELISLIGNQRVGIFPPKSEILFVLSLALIWYRNFQDRTIPLGGDTWPSFWRKELIIIIRIRIRIKKYRVQGSRFRSNISETVRDIRVPFSLLARCKSHATKCCNPRLCSCYRFWDIVVANINNFPILLEQTRICRRTSSHGIIKKYPRSGLFFRSNISETVGDILVLFSLWPRAIVALPNGANDVSVVHSLAASSIPVGCEMIQICQWCQSLQKITCFKKNDGVTSPTLAVLRYSRWRSRWPTNHTCSFFSGTIYRTDVILVSSIGFSGSENPKNIFNSFPNHHVTLKV